MFALEKTLLFLFIASTAFAQNSREIFYLENGMEFILIPQKSVPMIAGSFVVRAGSAEETAAESGAAHLLEHLLFNGTSKLSQKELYDSMDMLGGYFNASTSEDYANFVLLLERDNFSGGIDLLSQMLFDSTIPQDNFEKEIKIVEKELVQKQDRKQYWADLVEMNVHFAGTPYSRPVLGSSGSLKNISRDAVFGYYKKTYIPNNISAVIIGDFDPGEMQALLQEKFGAIPPGTKSAPHVGVNASPKDSPNTFKRGGIFYSSLDADRIYIMASVDAPAFRTPDFYTFYVLNDLMNEGTHNFWSERLEQNKDVISASSHFRFSGQISKFIVNVEAKPGVNVEQLRSLIAEALIEKLQSSIKKADLDQYLKNRQTDEIYMREKIHYYGLYKAELLALGGVLYPAEFERQISLVDKKSLLNLAEKIFPRDMALPLTTAVGPLPEQETLSAEKQEPQIKILPNGLTLAVLQDPASKVFAVNLLARDRARFEPEGKAGIAEILHRATLKGADGMDETELSDALKKIDAEVKVVDNPYIPYDDYYFSPRFSYIRLKTVEQHGDEALRLLADMVFKPDLSSKTLDEVKKTAINAAKTKGEDAREKAGMVFYSKLFGRSYPYLNPPQGIASDMENLTPEDLKAFHKIYFDPSNLILSVVSNKNPDEVSKTVEKFFSQPSEKSKTFEPYDFTITAGQLQSFENLGNEQAYIFAGKVFDFEDETPEAAEALSAAALLLSNELNFELREKQGLAYSMGASAIIRGKKAILIASMGTSPDKADEAGKELLRAWSEFKDRAFTEEEITRTINKAYGRRLMRSMTAENRAMRLGLDILDGKTTPNKYSPPAERAQYLAPEKISRMASLYLNAENYVMVVVK